MDYSKVLVTSGTNNPKPPRLGEGFKLEANDKQSRADMTDLVGNMSVYFARLKRIHGTKLSVLSLRGGGNVTYVMKTMNLFMAETELWIGGNLDLVGKIDTLKIEELEKKTASDEGREAMEEFMAIVK